MEFPPSRNAALAALEAFLPHAGRSYTERRNYDNAPSQLPNVSMLSPYIRHRLITEQEVIQRVLARHDFVEAEKFIQEVCWRTYWKGWLEMRPSVWAQYQADVIRLPRSSIYDDACAGATGIACFDSWSVELKATGYLHNHARMWFASLWIFVLGLPWQLGADFFYHHLLDGDPASNTLSWRWVAGLQTAGKTYLAQADNIEKFTHGRFTPRHFAYRAGPPPEAPVGATSVSNTQALPKGMVGLILTEEDLNPESLDLRDVHVTAVAGVSIAPNRSAAVTVFSSAALAEALSRTATTFQAPACMLELLNSDCLIRWARINHLKIIITPYIPIGPVRDQLSNIIPDLAAAGITLVPVRRQWDSSAWPFADKGFFAFKNHIPKLIGA